MQIHLLSFTDRIAVAFIMSSIKISQVYIEGCFQYCSDVQPLHSDIVYGNSSFDACFVHDKDFCIPYRGNSYISRVKILEKYSYIESNDVFDEIEISTLNYIAQAFSNEYIKQEQDQKK